jgi:hypothetical protein
VAMSRKYVVAFVINFHFPADLSERNLGYNILLVGGIS